MMPGKTVPLILASIVLLQSVGLLAGNPIAVEIYCWVLIGLTAVGAYFAHLRQLDKLGRENIHKDDEDTE